MLIYLKLFFTAFFWGGTFIAGKIIAKNVGPWSAAFLRFVIASTVLLFITQRLVGKFPKINKKQVVPILLLGLSGIVLYNFFFFTGLKLIEAGRGALIIATTPIFISLFSTCFFKEKLTPIKGFGVLISAIGAMIVISKGDPVVILEGHLGWGEFYIFGCVLSWTTFSLIGKSVITDISPLVSITYASVAGMVGLLVPAITEGLIQDLAIYSYTDWLSILYLGIFGTSIGFVWYYEGIKKLGPATASQFINLVPVNAVILAFFILDEPLTKSLLVGALCVITGVCLMNTASPVYEKANKKTMKKVS
ncbi:MAG: EamA family transporter [Deltaproteobacteria bacterium]|nr:EamA family transporter [Deltaproteobacteria bacterium]